MGRYKKQIFILILVGVLIIAFSLKHGEKNNIKINIKKNEIEIENFEMAKVVDEENNYYKLNADVAVIDRNTKSANLKNFTLVYKKGNTDLTAEADKGFLQEEVIMKASGKIKGVVNGLTFHTGRKGRFNYNFKKEIGVMSGRVVVNGEEGTIISNKAIIYHKKNVLEFVGNVKVNLKN